MQQDYSHRHSRLPPVSLTCLFHPRKIVRLQSQGDTLAERLRHESLEKRGVTIAPLMVGAFSRKPHRE